MHSFLIPTVRPFCNRLLGLSLMLCIFLAAEPLRAQPSVIDVSTVGSRTQRLLDQATALSEDGQWADAVETITLVMQQDRGKLVAAGQGRYVPVTQACQARLAEFPTEALTDYRHRIDPSARQCIDQAIESRDMAPLELVLNEYFLSSHAPRAILLLADLAIERGDYDTARRVLQRLAPELTDPSGHPIGVALRGIDLDQHWQQLLALLREPRVLLPACYPSAGDVLPEAVARLVLISLQERDFERAAIEIAFLEHLAPDARGWFAGREAPLAETLAGLLEEARTWSPSAVPSAESTFAATADRNGVAAPVGALVGPRWVAPQVLMRRDAPLPVPSQQRRAQFFSTDLATAEPNAGPRTYPIVYGPWVCVRNGDRAMAFEIATGEPAILAHGVLAEGTPSPLTPLRLGRNVRVWPGARRLPASILEGPPEGPFEIAEGVLYARMSPEKGHGSPSKNARPCVIGLDLNSDALEVVKFDQQDDPWDFSGPPLVEDGVAYVTLTSDEVRPRAAVAAYSVGSGSQLWFTPVCGGPPPAHFAEARATDVLCKSGGRLYLNTNMGAIAAVDAATGRLCWVAEYPRDQESISPDMLVPWQEVSPCVAYRGRVLVAPADASRVFALDAASGCVLWSIEMPQEQSRLLGAKDGVLVVGGRRLHGIDVDTGRHKYLWPESPRAGIRGMGRGCLAGEEVFWPTRDRVYIMHAATGVQSRPWLSLGNLGGVGANLAVAHGLLVAASPDKLTVFGPSPAEPSSDLHEEGSLDSRVLRAVPDQAFGNDPIIEF